MLGAFFFLRERQGERQKMGLLFHPFMPSLVNSFHTTPHSRFGFQAPPLPGVRAVSVLGPPEAHGSMLEAQAQLALTSQPHLHSL